MSKGQKFEMLGIIIIFFFKSSKIFE